MASITIDGSEYNLEDLSDSSRAQLASLQLTDQKIAQLQSDLAITQTARNAYANALKAELQK
tara:strand:- start:434 stop:619 length:186 start_codon:yes stop_codon:yes gene_type:complete